MWRVFENTKSTPAFPLKHSGRRLLKQIRFSSGKIFTPMGMHLDGHTPRRTCPKRVTALFVLARNNDDSSAPATLRRSLHSLIWRSRKPAYAEPQYHSRCTTNCLGRILDGRGTSSLPRQRSHGQADVSEPQQPTPKAIFVVLLPAQYTFATRIEPRKTTYNRLWYQFTTRKPLKTL
jgi:hypothetical protein